MERYASQSTSGCIIAMRSQTYASRGKRTLAKCGISAEIVSIDPSLTQHGCAYGLEIYGDCQAARTCLSSHHVPFGDILGGYGG